VNLLDFFWPSGVGEAAGIAIWAGVLSAGGEILGNLARVEFSYEEADAKSCTNFYVDGSSGTDDPGYGQSRSSSWASVTYALSQIADVPNDIVHVTAGSYALTGSPALGDEQQLAGSGPDSCVLTGAALAGSGDASLRNFTLTCPVTAGDQFTISHCILTGQTGAAVTCSGGTGQAPADQRIINNLFVNEGSGTAILCEDYSQPLIQHNTVTGWNYGVYCDDYSEATLRSNIITDHTAAGVFAGANAAALTSYNDLYGAPVQGQGVQQANNITDEPDFVSGGVHDYCLAQPLSANDTTGASAGVDQGDPSLFPPYLTAGSTRADGAPDDGVPDMGFHLINPDLDIVGMTDLNRDRHEEECLQQLGLIPADMIAIDTSSGRIKAFCNTGTGRQLWTEQVFPADTVAATAFRRGKTLERDIAALYEDALVIYENDGSAVFSTGQTFELAAAPYAAAAADFNGDAFEDLAVATCGGVLIYLNDQQGDLAAADPPDYGECGDSADARWLFCLDLDGDWQEDLVTVSLGG